jgi:hypothetical protein
VSNQSSDAPTKCAELEVLVTGEEVLERLQPLRLSAQERRELEAFLHSRSGHYAKR